MISSLNKSINNHYDCVCVWCLHVVLKVSSSVKCAPMPSVSSTSKATIVYSSLTLALTSYVE